MIITIIVTILMFLVMVSLHEFGHFIVGKLLNFEILEYSIGFGPKLVSGQKGETQYSLRCIPLGGYCKFEGEDTESDNPRAFSNQKVWKRILVVVAGGIFNIILGFVLFMIVVPMISPISTNVVSEIVPNSYAEQGGLLPGDEIIKIDGRNVGFYDDIRLAAQMFDANTDTTIVVKRDGKKQTLTFRLTEQIISYDYGADGIAVKQSINGEANEEEFYSYDNGAVRDEAKIGTEETVTRYIIGFVPVREDVNIFNVWGEAWNETKFVVKLVYQSLWQMITGKVGINQMSGPVGIVSEVNNAVNAPEGKWLNVLNLVALLTINLGVFNLLPIPALDGGRLLFMIIELIRRKPIPPDKEGLVHAVGMALLFALVIVISFNDIMRLIGG